MIVQKTFTVDGVNITVEQNIENITISVTQSGVSTAVECLGDNIVFGDVILNDIPIAFALVDLGLGIGDFITIRRSDNDAEDIFTPLELIDGTASTFVDGNDAFAKSLKNQGTLNLTLEQTDKTKQFQLYENGVLLTDDLGQPYLKSNGSSVWATNSVTEVPQPIDIWEVVKNKETTNSLFIKTAGINSDFRTFIFNQKLYINTGSNVDTGINTTFKTDIQNYLVDSPNGILFLNNKEVFNNINSGTEGFTGLTVGGNKNQTSNQSDIDFYGYFAFFGDKSTDREVITNKINTYYNTYVLPSEIDVWLVGGQSNTAGIVPTSDPLTPSYLQDNQVNGVSVWEGDRIRPYNLINLGLDGNGSTGNERTWAFKDVALKLIQDNTAIPQVVCMIAEGGTPISIAASSSNGCWNADYASIPSGTRKLLQELENRYLSLVSFCTANNITLNIKGLLWHQGEADRTDAVNYQANWQAVIDKVRSFTGNATLPIYHGTVPVNSNQYNATIRTAMLTIASGDADIYCRDNDDLTFYDPSHFYSEPFGVDVANEII